MDEAREAYLEELAACREVLPRRSGAGREGRVSVTMPSDLTGGKAREPWWKVTPPLVKVDLVTGKVLVFRWPLE
ncbi:MAG: hypothetical protein AB1510_07745 [Bacillota bacterium]